MRISEILSTPVNQGPGIKKSAANQANVSGAKFLGKGEFGKVYTNPKDIETAVKISSLNQGNWDADGYYNFIEKIKNIKQETHNPYLPQIYNVERIQPKGQSNPYLIVEVEKLFPTSSLSPEEAKIMFTKMIGRRPTQEEVDVMQARSGVNWKTSKPNPIDWVWATRNVMQSTIRSERWNFWNNFKIKDPQFKEALKIVGDLVDEGFTLDLHDENFMIRRTPYGNQIVLTDPLSFKTQSMIKVKSV